MKTMYSQSMLLVAAAVCASLGVTTLVHASEHTAAKPAAHSTQKPAGQMTPAERKRLHELGREANRLMANISIVRLALSADMHNVAKHHVNDALLQAESLAKQAATFNATDPTLAARLTFKAKAGQNDYWLPIENEEFVVRTLDEALVKQRAPEIVAADARAVHLRIDLDTQNVLREIKRAKTAIAEGNFGVAMAALDSAHSSSVVESDSVDLPLERVRDNLILARELSQDKNYGSAGFALGYAQTALTDAEKSDPALAKLPETAALKRELEQMQKQIKDRDTNALKRFETALDQWAKKVAGWVKRTS